MGLQESARSCLLWTSGVRFWPCHIPGFRRGNGIHRNRFREPDRNRRIAGNGLYFLRGCVVRRYGSEGAWKVSLVTADRIVVRLRILGYRRYRIVLGGGR